MAAAPELITDDPRRSLSPEEIELRELQAFLGEHGQCITSGQAARVLGCPSGTVAGMARVGQLSSVRALGGLLIPLAEVLAMKQLRSAGKIRRGRGNKSPRGAELLRAGGQ